LGTNMFYKFFMPSFKKGGEEEEKRRKMQTKGVTTRNLQYHLACCHYDGLFLAIVSIPGNYPDYTIDSHSMAQAVGHKL
jgi:hypothetical protein